MHGKRSVVVLAAAVAAVFFRQDASAQQHVYTPTATTENWSTSPNWSPALPAGGGADLSLIFSDNATTFADLFANTNTNNLGAFQLNILTLQGAGPASGAATITIASATGNSLNFVASTSGTPTNPIVNLNAVNTALTYAVTSDITLSNTTTFTGAGTATFNFSGPISGAGGITKSGASTLILSGANSYAGATTINNTSVLRISNSTALGSTATGTTINSGGVLQLTGGIAVGSESLSIVGDGLGSTTGAMNSLAGNNSWSGNLTVQSGTTTRINSASGSLTISGNVSLSPTTGDQFVLQGAGNGTISGVISGVSRLTKGANGAGTWTLTGANTYTGQTSISAGSLSVASLNSVSGGTASSNLGAPTSVAAGTINLGGGTAGGTLVYTGAGETTDRVLNLAGSSGGGGVTSNGTGPLVFTSSPTAADGSKTLTLQGNNTGDNTFTGAIGNPSSGSLSLTKTGTGRWVLGRTHTYAGTTNVTTGFLTISNGGALGTTTGGTSVASAGSLELTGDITVAGEALSLTGDGPNSGGVLRNVSGNNTWSGNITVNLGTNGTSRITSVAGNLSLTGGVTLTSTDQFVLQGDGTGSISGVISGTGRVTRSTNGNGVWTFSGTNTYTGATTISSGGISVATVGSVGSASSNLGAPADAASGTIQIGGNESTGTLIYTGPGETTNRVINLGGTTGGARVTASGTGPLAFTSAFTATGAGSKTLTLDGTNSGANTVGGAIVDNSAANTTAVTKSGAGTWVLGGNNTYTGNTTVSAGLLLVNGAHGSSASRIGANYSITASSSTASLGGDGDIFLASGRSVMATGSSAVNRAVIAPGSPFTGGIGLLSIDGGNGVVFGDNSTLAIDTRETTVSDLLITSGGLSLATATDRLALNSTEAGIYTVASYAGGSRSGVFDLVSINGINQPGTLSTVGSVTTFTATSNALAVIYDDTAGTVQVQITNPVPEPATAGVLAMAGIGLLGRRRRRK